LGFQFFPIIPDNSRLGNYRELSGVSFGDLYVLAMINHGVRAPAEHCCSITPPSLIGDCSAAKNWNPNNYQFFLIFPTRQSLPIIPNFSREACQTTESHLVESHSIFEVFL
jgi:hypothetical protein